MAKVELRVGPLSAQFSRLETCNRAAAMPQTAHVGVMQGASSQIFHPVNKPRNDKAQTGKFYERELPRLREEAD